MIYNECYLWRSCIWFSHPNASFICRMDSQCKMSSPNIGLKDISNGKLIHLFTTSSWLTTFGIKCSRMDQLKSFKGCLPQILLGPFLNTLSYLRCGTNYINIYHLWLSEKQIVMDYWWQLCQIFQSLNAVE